MSSQCKHCGISVPDGTTACQRCLSLIDSVTRRAHAMGVPPTPSKPEPVPPPARPPEEGPMPTRLAPSALHYRMAIRGLFLIVVAIMLGYAGMLKPVTTTGVNAPGVGVILIVSAFVIGLLGLLLVFLPGHRDPS